MERFEGLKFNSHKVHNPNCDIMEIKIDKDTVLTYGIYIKGEKLGEEFSEYYKGSNYVNNSTAKSYSKSYKLKDTPKKYIETVNKLKEIYNTQFKN